MGWRPAAASRRKSIVILDLPLSVSGQAGKKLY